MIIKLYETYNKVKDVFKKPVLKFKACKWQDSPLLPVWRSGPTICLGKYGEYTDKFNLKIKDNDGSVTRFEMYNSESGYMYFTNSSYFGQRYNNIITILDKEGIIRCNGIMSNSYSSSSYTFSFDLNGYKEAMKYIN